MQKSLLKTKLYSKAKMYLNSKIYLSAKMYLNSKIYLSANIKVQKFKVQTVKTISYVTKFS